MPHDKTFSPEKTREILDHAEQTLLARSRYRVHMDRQWYRNILSYSGEQWISFNEAVKRFERTNINRVVPRPVTNKMKPTLNAIIAALSRFEPKLTFAPQTNNMDDIVSAGAATKILSTIEYEVNWIEKKAILLPWLVLTGNAFLVSGYNENLGAKILKTKIECVRCSFSDIVESLPKRGICPNCLEKDGVEAKLKPVYDKNGQPVRVEKPRGQLITEAVNPFEMFLDWQVPVMEDQDTLIRVYPRSLTWIKGTWPEVDEKTPIQPHLRRELNAHLVSSLAFLSNPGTGRLDKKDTADIIEVWHKPDKQFPKGYYLRYTGQQTILDLEEYPYMTNRGDAFFPVSHFVFDRQPGSAIGSTPATDLVQKQWTRNRVESLGEMILLRMSNPVWIRPIPGTLSTITGQTGQVIDWDPAQSNNQPPARVEGANMPPAIVAWLDRIDRDFAEITAQFEVARGERPLAVRSGAAVERLQILNENRNTSLFVNFALGEAAWRQQVLEIYRIAMPEDRYFRVLGDEASWTVAKIGEADLKGGVDIIAEPSSVLPRTHTEKAAILELFLQFGLVNPQDPAVLTKIFQQFGMQEFLPGLSVDDEFIAREQDRWKQTGFIEVSPMDNHALHLARHMALYKSQGFENMPDQARNTFLTHITKHQRAYAGQIAAQQAQIAETEEATQ